MFPMGANSNVLLPSFSSFSNETYQSAPQNFECRLDDDNFLPEPMTVTNPTNLTFNWNKMPEFFPPVWPPTNKRKRKLKQKSLSPFKSVTQTPKFMEPISELAKMMSLYEVNSFDEFIIQGFTDYEFPKDCDTLERDIVLSPLEENVASVNNMYLGNYFNCQNQKYTTISNAVAMTDDFKWKETQKYKTVPELFNSPATTNYWTLTATVENSTEQLQRVPKYSSFPNCNFSFTSTFQ